MELELPITPNLDLVHITHPLYNTSFNLLFCILLLVISELEELNRIKVSDHLGSTEMSPCVLLNRRNCDCDCSIDITTIKGKDTR